MTRTPKLPDASHPITVTATEGRVLVRVGETVIADSTSSLTLQESTYPPVQYVPLADVEAGVLQPSDTTTYCPYKGDAAYYSATVAGETVTDVAWTYPEAYDAVAEIAGHVAFYPTKVELTLG